LDAAGGAAEMSALPQAVVPMLGKLVTQQINWIGTI
jgi:hypothetical protein